MTEQAKNIIEGIHKGRFGVEVEGNHITRENAAIIAAGYFSTNRYENTAARNGYQTWSAWDSKGREWRFAKDVSIKGPDFQKCELISPLLDYSELDFFLELLRTLRRAGMRSRPQDLAGIHIHVNEDGHTAKSLKNLAYIMSAREQQIGQAIRLDKDRQNRYCRTVNPEFLKRLKKTNPKTMTELEKCWYGPISGRNQKYHNSRYACLNYHSLFQGKGIEFRCFQFQNPHDGKLGGIHGGEMHAYIQLVLGISELAKQLRHACPTPVKTDNEKFSFRTWLLRLGFIGPEFKTARTILLRNMDGDSAFRFGRDA